jgi:hypothetical protein
MTASLSIISCSPPPHVPNGKVFGPDFIPRHTKFHTLSQWQQQWKKKKKSNYLQHIFDTTSPLFYMPTMSQKVYERHMIIRRFHTIDFNSYEYDCVLLRRPMCASILGKLTKKMEKREKANENVLRIILFLPSNPEKIYFD